MASGSLLQIYPFNFKPSAPPVGSFLMYMKTDNTLYLQDSTGVEYAFGSTGAITGLTGEGSASGPGNVPLTLSNAAIIGKVLTSFTPGPNSTVLATDTILQAFQKLQAQVTAGTGAAITSLNGDVSGTGPGATTTTVNSVGGSTASNVNLATIAANAATALNTPSTIVKRDGSGDFSANVVTADLVGDVTGNVSGSSASFTGPLSGDVTGTQSATAIASTVVTGKVLTGYTVGSNTPIAATDSILQAFEKTQGQLNAAAGASITSLTGDVLATGPGAAAATVVSVGGATATEIGYTAGVTSPIQAQLNAKSFPTASIAQTVHVNKGGNDGTADGTEFKPYLTVQAAITSITDAATSKRYAILVGPGLYTEPTLQIKPWIWIVGNGRSSTRINVTTGPNLVTLDPSWGTGTSRGGFIDMYFTGSTGFNGDLVALGGSTSAVFEFQDVFFNGNFIAKGRTTADFVEYLRGYLFGTTTLSSIQGFFFQIAQEGPLVIDTAGTADTTIQVLSTITQSTVTINQTSTFNCTPLLVASSMQGPITATRSGSGALTISADVSTIPGPSALTLSGGATLARLSDAYNLAYSPSTPANWPVVPSQVAQALDELASEVSGSIGAAITSLTGDVSATGPGAAGATVNSVGGSTASNINLATIAANAATSANTPNTIVKRDGSGNFAATLINGVAVEAHASRHNPGGADALAVGVPVQVGTANVQGSANSYSLSDHVHSHGNQTVGTLHAAVTTSVNGFMSAADKTKLDAATNANTPSTIVMRDASGNFSAGTITANLSGNATNFTGSLSGDVTGTQSATLIATGAVTDTKASLAVKPAVTAVATTNQALTGTPTIDGQATTANQSIVLLTAQSTASQNGPWVVQTGAWTRPTWYPSAGTTQSFQFITTFVRLGTVYGGSVWRQTAAAPITIDTTSTTWVVTPVSGNYKASYTIGPQSGTAEVDLVFANSTPGTLGWNPTATHKLLLPPTQGAAGTSLTNDGSGNLSWSSVQTNIDGGRPNSVFVIGLNIVGGTP